MKIRFKHLLVVCSPLFAALCQGGEPGWVGYGGPEGFRVYRDVNPPTKFGTNDIAWAVELPEKGWGHASPIVVGDKVILHVEYNEAFNRFPSLVAFNTKDGSVAWKALLDHTVALPDGEKIRAAWLKVTDLALDRQRIYQAYVDGGQKPEEKARLEAEGYQFVSYGVLIHRGRNAKIKAEFDLAAKGGLGYETWRQGGPAVSWCVGHAYATPVSDGQRVWVQTAFGGFFCFDLAGRLLWRTASVGQMGEYCRNGRSPILWRDPASGRLLLLSDITNKVRAFDALSGQLLWTDDGPGDFKYGREQGGGADTIITPAVMRVGQTEILVAAGLNCYRLPGGQKLKVEGWNVLDYGMQSLVKHDERDVLFLCGNGEHCGWRGRGGQTPPYPERFPPAALRFSLAGDTLSAKVLWEGRDLAESRDKWYARVGGGNIPSMLYHGGKYYHLGGAIFEALTGKRLAGQIYSQGRNQAVPETRHLLCVAGQHVYGLGPKPHDKTGAAQMSVYTLDGKKVADNIIPNPAGRGDFSYGYTFTFDKSSIYIRGLRHLIKIGK